MSKYEITVDGEAFTVVVDDVSGPSVQVVVNGVAKTVQVSEAAPPAPVARPEPAPEPIPAKPEPQPITVEAPAPPPPAGDEGQSVVAPMPGKILSITVSVGDSVSEGDIVCTLEAMKMEMPIASSASGTVQRIDVQVGDTVAYDAPLVTIG